MTVGRLSALCTGAGLLFAISHLTGVATTLTVVLGVAAYCTALGAVAVGVRRHRPSARLPWLLVAGGLFGNLGGASTFYVYAVLGIAPPGPGPQDVFFLPAYPLFAAALVLWRVRRGGRDTVAAVDVTIVIAVVGTLAWLTLIMPSSSAPGLSTGQVLIATLYPCGDLLIIAAALRILLSAERPPPALWLIVAGVTSFLITDVGFAVNTVYLGAQPELIVLFSTFNYPAFGLIGAAALHPSMATLDQPAAARSDGQTRARLLLLATALFLAPVAQFVSYLTGATQFVPIYAFLSMVLSALVMTRMWLMLGEQRRLAVTDGLTGLHSRRFFEEALGTATGRRTGVIGVLLVDVDHFKKINDGYGHAAGDAVLRELAHRLSASVRTQDVVARYGGEEFAVLLQEVDTTLARAVAERLRESVAATPMDVGDGVLIPVTVSVGVCTQPVAEGIGDQVMVRADRSLYSAKEHGRNQVVVADALAG
ncbi:sensor domain-containing diguanylate cyclase [Actinoplanes rectilineatus]|uniref:sensor domain-containing diguanylate cyclase n=1 Tax=Actinoplanes rectilineatus TaxID=113571 RepID=UPI0005F2CE2B|nr:GGDEF domain-containing protein [Actinoplanes rectilineatus]